VVHGCGTKTGISFFVRISHSVLCIVLAAAATAKGADPDGNAPVGKGLLSGLFHEKPKTQAKIDKKGSDVPPQPASTGRSSETERQRYVNAWIRRVEVCDRLRSIADQTANQALMTQADELEERANALYRLQTAGLPLAAQAPVTVLASDRENTSRVRRGTAAAAPPELVTGSGAADHNRPQASSSPARLGGSMDQREQAILNGTSMGEDRP
jgi:hypothetical protein